MPEHDIGHRALALHKKLRGKIRIEPTAPIRNRVDLSLVYTPGVGAVSSYLAKHKKKTRHYTIKGNTIAIVSDGSAVLGLGNIGPEGALPVMEGKAALFKIFAGVDAFPLVLATQDPREIIETVIRVAPAFGGINLEDIAAPKCFEIEEELKKRLSIPVMHDDQHGTAIVVLAGLLNAFCVVKKDIKTSRIVILGAGAAGTALAVLLHRVGAKNLLILDSRGVIGPHRSDLSPHKRKLSKISNRNRERGGLDEAISGADAIIGVSGPGTIHIAHVRRMAPNPIVFALANPIPEIMPDEAQRAGAAVIATGRSDFPNQINNSLVFPGVFRGALDHNVRTITDAMKLRAARNLAALVRRPTARKIIPDAFDRRVPIAVAKAIR